MCSISANATVDTQFGQLDKKKKTNLKKRIFDLADEANVSQSAALDETSCHMKRMPPELRKIRKKRIGRHRLYYTGFHTQCSYHAFYLKVNKQKGVDDDDNKVFQDKLSGALNDPDISLLSDPNVAQANSSEG